MPIGIYDAAAYRSIGPVLGHYLGPVWVIPYSVITVLYSDVLTGSYCFVSCYPFPLENAGIRLRL